MEVEHEIAPEMWRLEAQTMGGLVDIVGRHTWNKAAARSKRPTAGR